MLDLFLKLIVFLGLQYGLTEKGEILMSQSDITKLTSSKEYIESGSPSTTNIITTKTDIVVVPEVDPITLR
jgi:hypothetical protein